MHAVQSDSGAHPEKPIMGILTYWIAVGWAPGMRHLKLSSAGTPAVLRREALGTQLFGAWGGKQTKPADLRVMVL